MNAETRSGTSMYGTIPGLSVVAIMRHGCGCPAGDARSPPTGEGYRHSSYRDVGQQRPAGRNALRRLVFEASGLPRSCGTAPSAGYAPRSVDGRGAAYPQHPALPRQIAYVTNEAEDRVILVGLSWPGARRCCPSDTVHTVIAVERATRPLREAGKTVLRYAELVTPNPPTSGWPQIDENSAAAMCYQRYRQPKGVVYSRFELSCTMAPAPQVSGSGPVTRCCRSCRCFHAGWGLPICSLDGGCGLWWLPDHLDSLIHMVGTAEADTAGAVPAIWNDVMHYEGPRSRHVIARPGRHRRNRRFRIADAHLRGQDHDVQIRQLWA